MKVFVIDQKYCNGCYGCQIACKDEHCGNDWMPYQKPQPELGHFWMKLQETTHGQVPRVKLEYRPYMCQHCDKCPLVEKWPDIVSKREDGLVCIDPVKAEGKKELVDACPYGAVYWNEELSIAQKCDGCAHLVDAGEVPHCVELCPTEAIKFGEESEFADVIPNAERIDFGTESRVYYLNAPHLFIGGGVWNSDDDEVIIGAKVTLTKPDGSTATTETDDFGDFWFRKLDAGDYKISIQADGYQAVWDHVVKLDESLNVGDFDMAKA